VRRHPKSAAALVLVLFLVALLATLWGFVFLRPQPTIDGDQRLLGLRERAEVLRDGYGVPHVFAANDHDLFFLQGYITAGDRMFQMDLYRRAAQGRLSEVLGEPTVESDTFMRTIGLARAAKADLSVLSPDTIRLLQDYADGVNKYLVQHDQSLPVEFLLLGYQPDPWTALDTLAIAKLQVYDAAGNYPQELLRADIATRLGTSAVATLMPDATTISAGIDETAWAQVARQFSPGGATPGPAALDAVLGGAGQWTGSNCWALGGGRTKSGKPILAGDPHLPVRNPSIWYEVALDAGDLHLIGFSIPGVPGVVIGHNDRVAWSFTYAYADTQDLFVEHQDPSDLRRYEYKGSFEPASYVREEVRVKGRAVPVTVDVAITRHGPIITPVLEGQTAQVALRWSALDGGTTVEAVFGMNRARSWDEFRSAAAGFTGAALSACYADVDGHIGYLLVGRLPDRKGDGSTPVPGWTGEYDWRGLLPASANLAIGDPSDGLVLNANNRPVTSTDAAGWNGEWDPGFRYQYLRDALERGGQADLASTMRLQNDYTSVPVTRFREALLSAKPRTAQGQQLQDVARAWDGSLGVDSAGAAVYEAWLVRFAGRTFRAKLGPELYERYLADGRPISALYALVPDASSQWFAELGDPAISGRDAIAGEALDDAARDLITRLGSDMTKWRWGDLHQVVFDHPLAAVKPLDLVLNIGPVRRAGDGYSPNNGAYPLTKPFAQRTHPSERQIVDLADVNASVSVIPTGESGMPFSKYWGDQTRLWAEGRYKPMALARDRIGPLDGRLVLRAQ